MAELRDDAALLLSPLFTGPTCDYTSFSPAGTTTQRSGPKPLDGCTLMAHGHWVDASIATLANGVSIRMNERRR